MKTNDDSFFAEALNPRREARELALEALTRLLIWMYIINKDGKLAYQGAIDSGNSRDIHLIGDPRIPLTTSRSIVRLFRL